MPRDEKKEKAAGAKKGKKKSPRTRKSDYYIVSGEKLERKNYCPKCGSGVFMAQHRDRQTCGNCGYTEWKTAK